MNSGDTVDGHTRWCAGCGHVHGPLYRCPKYPKEVLEEIDKSNKQYMENLSSIEWCRSQVENGVPLVVINAFRVLSGLDELTNV